MTKMANLKDQERTTIARRIRRTTPIVLTNRIRCVITKVFLPNMKESPPFVNDNQYTTNCWRACVEPTDISGLGYADQIKDRSFVIELPDGQDGMLTLGSHEAIGKIVWLEFDGTDAKNTGRIILGATPSNTDPGNQDCTNVCVAQVNDFGPIVNFAV
jgi:hypothetical protein